MERHMQVLYIISRADLRRVSTRLYSTYFYMQCHYYNSTRRDNAYRVCASMYGILSSLVTMLRLIPSGAVYECSEHVIRYIVRDVHAQTDAYETYVNDIFTLDDDERDGFNTRVLGHIRSVTYWIRTIDSSISNDILLQTMRRRIYEI